MINLEKYYGLVIYRARKYHAALPAASQETLALEDLVQIGYMRLVEAQAQYQTDQGTTFATFAMYRIEFAIMDYLRQIDPLTIRERQRLKALQKAQSELAQQVGREPSIAELAQFVGITEEAVEKTLTLPIYIASIDAPGQADGGSRMQSAADPPAPDLSPEEQIMQKQLAQSMETCLQTALDTEERQVVTLRYTGGLTRARIGSLLDLHRSKVERVERLANQKLRACLASKGWEISDI